MPSIKVPLEQFDFGEIDPEEFQEARRSVGRTSLERVRSNQAAILGSCCDVPPHKESEAEQQFSERRRSIGRASLDRVSANQSAILGAHEKENVPTPGDDVHPSES